MRSLPANKAGRALQVVLLAFLITGQALLAGYLLGLQVWAAVALAVIGGAAAGWLWRLPPAPGRAPSSARVSGVMFAMGGFGMLLGLLLDLDRLGPYTLLEFCTAIPGFDPSSLWRKLSYMPWTCAGMLLASNAGMLVFDALDRYLKATGGVSISIYLMCNLGMILGMQAGEWVALKLPAVFGLGFAAAMVLASMLLGMWIGMWFLMYVMTLLERIQRRLRAVNLHDSGPEDLPSRL